MALFGCTVTPGFDFADYRSGSYVELAAKWPAESRADQKLTRTNDHNTLHMVGFRVYCIFCKMFANPFPKDSPRR